MNKIHHFAPNIFAPLLIALSLLSSCDKLIYEDLEECPQGVLLSFHHQTPCMQAPAEVGEVSGLHLFTFDLNDKLVKVETVTGKVDLSQSFRFVLPPVEKGQYTVIAWAGADSQHFVHSELKEGESTKNDVLMTLKSSNDQSSTLQGHKVWQGESKVISLPDRKKHGSLFVPLAINMLEVTNRLNVTLTLHESVRDELSIEDFDISLSSSNATYRLNRYMPLGTPQITYPGTEIARDSFSKTLAFTLLELKSGYNNALKVYNKKENKEYLSQDLLGKLLLDIPNLNLECTHDFDILIEIEDKCKSCPSNNLVLHIYINNYLIHSFGLELENRY